MKVTPVPIPNTMVKLQSADGTAGVALWKSRLSPGHTGPSPASKQFAVISFSTDNSKLITDNSPGPFSAKFCGGTSERETPVPIPNTEVKPLCADDTARAALWESRAPPRFLFEFSAFYKVGNPYGEKPYN